MILPCVRAVDRDARRPAAKRHLLAAERRFPAFEAIAHLGKPLPLVARDTRPLPAGNRRDQQPVVMNRLVTGKAAIPEPRHDIAMKRAIDRDRPRMFAAERHGLFPRRGKAFRAFLLAQHIGAALRLADGLCGRRCTADPGQFKNKGALHIGCPPARARTGGNPRHEGRNGDAFAGGFLSHSPALQGEILFCKGGRAISCRFEKEVRPAVDLACYTYMSKHKPVVFDDDNPEWTEEDFARARPASEIVSPAILDLLVRKPGRPIMAENDRKQKVNIRLSPDVLEALRAGGAGWQTRADELLREGLRLGKR